MSNLNLISLYSGAGGLDLGFKQAGFNICLAVENDENCCLTLKQNFKNINLLKANINDLSPKQILKKAGKKKIDIIIGGPPCQSFSLAGQRKGLKDSNGAQILNFINIIKVIKPKIFLLENVKGMVNWENGKVIKFISEQFSKKVKVNNKELQYRINYKVLNAADYGVPQIRERVFIIGNLFKKDFIFPETTHSKKQNQLGLFKNKQEYRTVKDAIYNLPKAEEPSAQALSVSKTIKGRIEKHGY